MGNEQNHFVGGKRQRLDSRHGTHHDRNSSSLHFSTLHWPSWRYSQTNSRRFFVRTRSIYFKDEFCVKVCFSPRFIHELALTRKDRAVFPFHSHSPAYYTQLYKENSLIGGHIIKLGPGNDDAAREALAAWPGDDLAIQAIITEVLIFLEEALQLGGGINDTNALDWLNAGAQKVDTVSPLFWLDSLILFTPFARL